MRLLLVEDDENKRVQLLELISSKHKEIEVSIAGSLISGIRKAQHEQPDLILLDMTLPNYDLRDGETGGGMHAFGGLEFLKQMRRLNLKSLVIVVTQFETFGHPPDVTGLPELEAQMRAAFSPQYLGAVYYHASIEDWAEKLEKLIHQATRET